jgi:hypothetical protein
MGGMQKGQSLLFFHARKFLKMSELFVDLGEGPGQHLAMPRAGAGLKLIHEALAGKQKSITLAVEFLLGWRQARARGFARVCHVGLLLFYRFAFPTARHSGADSFFNFEGCLTLVKNDCLVA